MHFNRKLTLPTHGGNVRDKMAITRQNLCTHVLIHPVSMDLQGLALVITTTCVLVPDACLLPSAMTAY